MLKLNEQNYFSPEADRAYFSASQVKSFKRCEAAALAQIRGEYTMPMSQALLQGQFVDESLTGDYGAWSMKHYSEITKRDGNLKAEFMLCQEMVSRARRDEVFMEFMEGEHQVILTEELFSVPFKAKLDVLGSDKIVDLKTVRDLSPVYLPGQGRVDFATAWDWPLQMAIYQELYRKNYGEKLPCYLAVITKETPPDIRIIHIEQERLDAELAWLGNEIRRYEGIKDGVIEPVRCEQCAWCRESRILTGSENLSDFEEGGYTNE